MQQQYLIPKNIFQTYTDLPTTEAAKKAQQSWQRLNPDWNYYFFDDQQQRAFIEKHFDDDVLWTYDQLIPGAYKADLWRYCVLYIEGGIYVDHKMQLNMPLKDVIPDNIEFATLKDRPAKGKNWHYDYHLWQGFILAKARHPFLKKAIELIVVNVQQHHYCETPLSITGPGLLGKAINISTHKDPQNPIQPGQYTFEHGLYDIFPAANMKAGHDNMLFNKKNVIKPYPNYQQDRLQKSFQLDQFYKTDYMAAWFMGKVYRQGGVVRNNQHPYFKSKLKGFYRRTLLKSHQFDPDFAYQLIRATLHHKWFQPKIWFIWLKYTLSKQKPELLH